MSSMTNTLHSPVDIETILKVYYGYRWCADMTIPAEISAVHKFVHLHLIKLERDDKDYWYELTEKGKAFVDMVLNTPYPIQVWVDPRN